MIKNSIFRVVLFGLAQAFNFQSRRHASFRNEARKQDFIFNIRLRNDSIGRHYIVKDGLIVKTKFGSHPEAPINMVFKNVDTALKILSPTASDAFKIHAAKNFLMLVEGPDPLVTWFLQLMQRVMYEGFSHGKKMNDGSMRYTTMTNGGPLFVYVRDGKILRVTPIEFTDKDAPSWAIKARGKTFRPRRVGTVAPHGMSYKSAINADNRILYPMKRVDFDPDGERNPQNRGKSEYERISWDEATNIIAKEINRQKAVHGPGSIFLQHGSHHQWGNVNYYLSAMYRFANLIGFTRMAINPDSWEGWYWGATHHYGHSMRIGAAPGYGTTEDCLKEAEQIVFWSSDPESTNATYGGFDSTQRRLWAKELGLDFVHIDPHFNPTAQLLGGKWLPVKPGSDSALSQAIMNVWINEDLYDKEYVATRTTGFDEWKAYILGEEDGIPKTPEWQEDETGVPARDVRALARKWASKKTYLACGVSGNGFGGACRGANGAQWARNMVMMLAMQGWGKPGINMGNLVNGAPVDLHFYFPGYAEGGISGDLQNTASAVNNYQRMPHILTMNAVKQQIPKQRIPDAILDGKTTGYLWDGISQEAQFTPVPYPMEGYSPIHMIYRYGSSAFSTTSGSARFIESYRHDSIECVVNQSVFLEGETKFADIILPACSNLERWDIGEWCHGGGYVHHGFEVVNHRVVALQNKCIEPLGESKSDYDIFTEIMKKLGLGSVFTEGCGELDWVKRVFDSSDIPKHMSWEKFRKRGYFVIPSEVDEKLRPPVSMNWFAEDRHKDTPEPQPLPSQYAEQFGFGLQTPSGKFEFIPTLLKRNEHNHPDRPALNRYVTSWEGPKTTELVKKYPLQMLAAHCRYSFHTFSDGSDFTDQIRDHRREIDGTYYWIMRMSPDDAAARGIKQDDLVKVFNDRGAVICAADICSLLTDGVVKSLEASSRFQQVKIKGELVEVGGSLNILTPSRLQSETTHSMSPNSTLVQVEKYEHAESLKKVLAA